MKRFFRNNGLSLVLFWLFFGTFIIGQTLVGMFKHNHDRRQHGDAPETYLQYVVSADFLEATAENWESEFLQLFTYVLLTRFLYQKGSAESRDPDKPAVEDEKDVPTSESPWPVRRGGVVLKLYEHSLTVAFFFLFLISILLHAVGGAGEYNQEQRYHGQEEQLTPLQYMLTSSFWFESLQNWQSEFLALFVMVVLSIWLREKDSPESKPVTVPHSTTGK